MAGKRGTALSDVPMDYRIVQWAVTGSFDLSQTAFPDPQVNFFLEIAYCCVGEGHCRRLNCHPHREWSKNRLYWLYVATIISSCFLCIEWCDGLFLCFCFFSWYIQNWVDLMRYARNLQSKTKLQCWQRRTQRPLKSMQCHRLCLCVFCTNSSNNLLNCVGSDLQQYHSKV